MVVNVKIWPSPKVFGKLKDIYSWELQILPGVLNSPERKLYNNFDMQVNEIRSSFLNYFGNQGHKVFKSSPLVPNNDPTLMFTTAGMVPFKDYFTGKSEAEVKRATSSQKCVRAGGKHNDLENVGYTARHHTFFEMLGNFSFGDYFKDLAIEFAWNYLTQVINLPKEKLYITIYHDDDEALGIWKKITGFSDNKIIRIATSDNFWAMGDTGPCGPCSEIFYDHGEKYTGGLPGTPDADGDRYIEIWNLVFMQFEQLADGKRVNLPKPSIDTGMGLERISAVVQGTNHNYETDLFKTIIHASQEISGNPEHITSHRVIADHLRSSCFLLADGVMPSNEGRGYVLRRIMRRAMRHIHNLGVKDSMMHKLVPVLIREMGTAYPELGRAEGIITSTLRLEEDKFKETLDRGMKLLSSSIESLNTNDTLSGEVAFKLYDTYGFPIDLTRDILKSKKIHVDEAGFEREMAEQKKRAKAAWVGSGDKATEEIWYDIHENAGATEFIGYFASEGEAKVTAIIKDGKQVESVESGDAIIVLNQTPFYGESGGQVGDTGLIGENEVSDVKKFLGEVFGHFVKVKKKIAVGDIVHCKIDNVRRSKIRANHSATHLLHRVLREHLGSHVVQKGSIVTPDKLRFDFSQPQALTVEQIASIEKEVNQMVIDNHAVCTEITSPENAIAKGAMALFGEKYGDEVRAVSMGESIELCGGTHVSNTGDIGLFKIVSEEAIASGVRRIEAVTGIAALEYLNNKELLLKQVQALFKCSESEVLPRVEALLDDKKRIEKEISSLRISQIISSGFESEKLGEVEFVTKRLEGVPPQDLRTIALEFMKKIESGVIVITSIYEGKVSLIVNVTKNLTSKYSAADLIKPAAVAINGNGGGKPDFAQAGGTNVGGVEEAVKIVKSLIK